MLVISRRAEEKLQEIAEKEAPDCDIADVVFGVRIVLSGPDNGTHGNKCRIGIDQAQTGDLMIDMGGKKLLIDPETLTHLHHMSAILDLVQGCSREDLVLMVEGADHNLRTFD